ncbi:MAG: acyl-CoA dehydrogenase family protein [Chloroflexi bacterium]|nr:acyl-CoA dehydrogenase family protein [Chloroflexota bacterium]
MDFELDEAHRLLRDTVATWAEREIGPIADEIDRSDEFPAELWPKMGQLGILGVTVAPEYGGAGFDLLAGVLSIEQIARFSGSIALSYGAHANLCVNNLFRNGDDAQRRRYLPALCDGNAIGALAMTEPEAGSDAVGGMQARAVRDGDDYVLNGTKMFITNGPVADTLVLYAKTAPEKRQHGITAFIVEKGMPGFSVSRKLDKFGHRGSPTGELVLEDVRVPAANVLRRENEGVAVMMSGLDSERAFLAGESLGLAERALELSIAYAKERRQFGQPIGNFQLIQGKLADMYVQVEATRWLVYRTAVAADRAQQEGRRFSKEAAASIMYAAEVSTRVALDAMQIHGGYGYLNDSPIGRIVRDAKLLEIGAGTTEIRKTIIARDLLGLR